MNADFQDRPSVFISYAQSSPAWQQIVMTFAVALRRVGGVDAELDLFHGSSHRQWTTFGPSLIRSSDYVLIAVDEAYKRRWDGTERAGVGAGAAREADVLKAVIDKDRVAALRRLKVVILPGVSREVIPDDLRGFLEYFEVRSSEPSELESLLRSIWGKPAYPKPDLGPIPTLPPRAVADIGDEADLVDDGAEVVATDAGARDLLSRILGYLVRPADGETRGPSRADRIEDDKRLRETVETALRLLPETVEADESVSSDEAFPPAVARLVAALSDPDEDVRYEAMSALDDRLVPALLPTIEALLEDRDPHIKRLAYGYYARLQPGSLATPKLVEGLASRDEDIRYEAMNALDDRLSGDLLPVVEALLEDRDRFVRRMAYAYYARLQPGSRALPKLLKGLSDDDDDVRYEAMSALDGRVVSSLLPVIEKLLNDKDKYIRRMALRYYAELTSG